MWKQVVILLSLLNLANAGWVQTFADEFRDEGLDLSKWSIGTGKSWDQEAQQYMPDAFTFTGETMKIIAQAQVTDARFSGKNNYTSGSVSTSQKFSQAYGYWEMKARTPTGQGFWPAFWLMDNSWTCCYNEIDIVEQLSKDPSTIYTTYHWSASGDQEGFAAKMPNWDSNVFHTYAVQWIPGLLLWYVDGVNVWNLTNPKNLVNNPKYLIVNMAIGASWGGWPTPETVFPNFMEVEYVRVYSYSSTSGVSLTGPGSGIAFSPEPQQLPRCALKGYTITPQIAQPGDTVTFSSTVVVGDAIMTGVRYQYLLSEWTTKTSLPNNPSGMVTVNTSSSTEYTFTGTFTIPADYSQPYISFGHGLFDQSWTTCYWGDVDTVIGVSNPVGWSSQFPGIRNPNGPTPPPPGVPGAGSLSASSGVWRFEFPSVDTFSVGTWSGKWRCNGAAGITNGAGYESATHEGQYAFLQGSDSAWIATLSLESNFGEWMITWMESGRVAGSGGGNPYDGNEPYTLTVIQSGKILSSSSFKSSSSSPWTNRTVVFNATTSGEVTLKFNGDTSSTDSTALLDDINVVFIKAYANDTKGPSSASTGLIEPVTTESAVTSSALVTAVSFVIIAILSVF